MRVRGWDGKEPGGRPNPRGNRPRTKERPSHDDAVAARVLTIDRGRFTVLVDEDGGADGEGHERTVTAMRAREMARSGIGAVAVGDRVDVVGDVSGTVDTLARVVRVRPRTAVLRRTADDTDPIERVIVANADQLLVVSSAADPEPNLRMVDRCLAAAFDAGMGAAIALTKTDLGDPEPVLQAYRGLDVPVLVLARTTDDEGRTGVDGLDAVREWLDGLESVLVGPSGVGKSTLVNALVPSAHRATGVVNTNTGQGRHTSSSAVALRLEAPRAGAGDPGGGAGGSGLTGWVVDTPGVRSFGLAHLEPQRLLAAFSDLSPGSDRCPRGCSHDEPECALDAWVAGGHAGPAGAVRLASLRRLLQSRAGEEDPHHRR